MKLSTYTQEFRANIKLAYPVVLGMVGHTLIAIVDKLMVGNLGAAELAAVSLGNSFIFVAMSLGIGFSTAITPIVAEGDAAGDDEKIRGAFSHGLLLCTALGIFLFAAVSCAKPLMYLMGQPEDVITLARPYLDWVAFSLIPMVMYQAYKQFGDGMSHTKYSMYAIVLGNIIHVPLNYALIYGFWIIPEYGVTGAGLGTVISRIFMLIFLHFLLANDKKLKTYFSGKPWRHYKKETVRKIVNIGLPSSMQMLFEVALFTSAVWLCGSIGKTSQAANEIALSLATLTFMFAMGLSVTAMIRVGNQRGLNDYKKLLIVARSIFLLVILVESVFAVLFVIGHQYLPQLFLDTHDAVKAAENSEVVAIAGRLLIVAAIFQISDGVQVVVLAALRGLQDVKVPMYATFAAYWMIGFPVSYWLGKHTTLGATGVWIGLLAGLTAAAVFLYLRFDHLTKKKIREADANAIGS